MVSSIASKELNSDWENDRYKDYQESMRNFQNSSKSEKILSRSAKKASKQEIFLPKTRLSRTGQLLLFTNENEDLYQSRINSLLAKKSYSKKWLDDVDHGLNLETLKFLDERLDENLNNYMNSRNSRLSKIMGKNSKYLIQNLKSKSGKDRRLQKASYLEYLPNDFDSKIELTDALKSINPLNVERTSMNRQKKGSAFSFAEIADCNSSDEERFEHNPSINATRLSSQPVLSAKSLLNRLSSSVSAGYVTEEKFDDNSLKIEIPNAKVQNEGEFLINYKDTFEIDFAFEETKTTPPNTAKTVTTESKISSKTDDDNNYANFDKKIEKSKSTENIKETKFESKTPKSATQRSVLNSKKILDKRNLINNTPTIVSRIENLETIYLNKPKSSRKNSLLSHKSSNQRTPIVQNKTLYNSTKIKTTQPKIEDNNIETHVDNLSIRGAKKIEHEENLPNLSYRNQNSLYLSFVNNQIPNTPLPEKAVSSIPIVKPSVYFRPNLEQDDLEPITISVTEIENEMTGNSIKIRRFFDRQSIRINKMNINRESKNSFYGQKALSANANRRNRNIADYFEDNFGHKLSNQDDNRVKSAPVQNTNIVDISKISSLDIEQDLENFDKPSLEINDLNIEKKFTDKKTEKSEIKASTIEKEKLGHAKQNLNIEINDDISENLVNSETDKNLLSVEYVDNLTLSSRISTRKNSTDNEWDYENGSEKAESEAYDKLIKAENHQNVHRNSLTEYKEIVLPFDHKQNSNSNYQTIDHVIDQPNLNFDHNSNQLENDKASSKIETIAEENNSWIEMSSEEKLVPETLISNLQQNMMNENLPIKDEQVKETQIVRKVSFQEPIQTEIDLDNSEKISPILEGVSNEISEENHQNEIQKIENENKMENFQASNLKSPSSTHSNAQTVIEETIEIQQDSIQTESNKTSNIVLKEIIEENLVINLSDNKQENLEENLEIKIGDNVHENLEENLIVNTEENPEIKLIDQNETKVQMVDETISKIQNSELISNDESVSKIEEKSSFINSNKPTIIIEEFENENDTNEKSVTSFSKDQQVVPEYRERKISISIIINQPEFIDESNSTFSNNREIEAFLDRNGSDALTEKEENEYLTNKKQENNILLNDKPNYEKTLNVEKSNESSVNNIDSLVNKKIEEIKSDKQEKSSLNIEKEKLGKKVEFSDHVIEKIIQIEGSVDEPIQDIIKKPDPPAIQIPKIQMVESIETVKKTVEKNTKENKPIDAHPPTQKPPINRPSARVSTAKQGIKPKTNDSKGIKEIENKTEEVLKIQQIETETPPTQIKLDFSKFDELLGIKHEEPKIVEDFKPKKPVKESKFEKKMREKKERYKNYPYLQIPWDSQNAIIDHSAYQEAFNVPDVLSPLIHSINPITTSVDELVLERRVLEDKILELRQEKLSILNMTDEERAKLAKKNDKKKGPRKQELGKNMKEIELKERVIREERMRLQNEAHKRKLEIDNIGKMLDETIVEKQNEIENLNKELENNQKEMNQQLNSIMQQIEYLEGAEDQIREKLHHDRNETRDLIKKKHQENRKALKDMHEERRESKLFDFSVKQKELEWLLGMYPDSPDEIAKIKAKQEALEAEIEQWLFKFETECVDQEKELEEKETEEENKLVVIEQDQEEASLKSIKEEQFELLQEKKNLIENFEDIKTKIILRIQKVTEEKIVMEGEKKQFEQNIQINIEIQKQKLMEILEAEKEAKEEIKRDLENYKESLLVRREKNLELKSDLSFLTHTQNITKPFVFSYLTHWPIELFSKPFDQDKTKKTKSKSK